MKLYEVIYTSSDRVLDSGSGNLGVVARTRGFPNELESELIGLRSYTILDGMPVNATEQHPARFAIAACGKVKRYVLLSQTVFAGADHTGRTRPLSHQVLISLDEIRQDHSTVAEIARVVFPILRTTWNEAPMWIDPPQAIVLSSPSNHGSLLPDGATSNTAGLDEELIVSIADALIAFSEEGRAVVICLPHLQRGMALELAIALLSVLPSSIQLAVALASHVIDVSDCPRNAGLLFTYPGTPFWEHTNRRQDPRKPYVFDLTRKTQRFQGNGPFRQALAQLGEPASSSRLMEFAKCWDAWGLVSADASLFPGARKLYAALTSETRAQDLARLGPAVQQCRGSGQLASSVDSWCNDTVERLSRLTTDWRWDSLAVIQTDRRWPESARASALQKISTRWELSLPHLLAHDEHSVNISSEPFSGLLDAVLSQPSVIEHALTAAATDWSPMNQRLSHLVCEGMPWNFERTRRCLKQISGAPLQMRDALRPVLLKRIATHARRIDEIASVCPSADDPISGDAQYCCDVCDTVLRPHIQSAKQGPGLDRLCTLLLDTSRCCGRVAAEWQWLTHKVGRHKIGPHLVEQWTAAAGERLSPRVSADASIAFELGADNPEQDSIRVRRPMPSGRGRGGLRFLPFLRHGCFAAGIATVVGFLFTQVHPQSLDGLRRAATETRILLLSPVALWAAFEVALRVAFPSYWKAHALGRGILSLTMLGCLAWMIWGFFGT